MEAIRDVMKRNPIDRNSGAIEGFSGRFGKRNVAGRIAGLFLPSEAGRPDGANCALGQTVLGIREGIELNDDRISDVHEAVLVAGNIALDLEPRVCRHQRDEVLT